MRPHSGQLTILRTVPESAKHFSIDRAIPMDRIMASVRSTNTKPEMRVRRTAHRMGYRYRLHRKDLPGKPDLVFPSRRIAMFVHGCFWHGHPCKCGDRMPATNVEYWREKIARNQRRDASNWEALCELGWIPVVVWECQTTEERLATLLDTILTQTQDG